MKKHTKLTHCCQLALLRLAFFAVFWLFAAAAQAQPGAALNFDGFNDYVALPDALATAVTGGGTATAVTVEYWFKGSSLTSGVRIQNGGDYLIVGWAFNGALQHIISTDGGISGVSAGAVATINDGNWHHIAMTWQANTTNGFKSYLDGVLVEERNSSNVNLPNISTGMFLGCYNGTSEFINGSLDEVRIWNIARSDCDIATFYNCEIDPATPGLLASYHFNQGTAGGDNTAIANLANAVAGGVNGTFGNFALTGTISNLIEPGAVTSGIACAYPIAAFNVTGSGTFCPGSTGVQVGLSGSETDVNYQLQKNGVEVGSPLAGTGSALDFGSFSEAATYTVTGTDISGCSVGMNGSAILTAETPELPVPSANPTNVCSGTTSNLSATASVGTIDWFDAATGGNLLGNSASGANFPVAPTTTTTFYAQINPNGSPGCFSNDRAAVVVAVLPALFSVTGGGTFCSGGTGVSVGLSDSELGVDYQLKKDNVDEGSPLAGTGEALDFGTTTAVGNYTVEATFVAGGCTETMTGSAVIAIASPPTATLDPANSTTGNPLTVTLSSSTIVAIEWQNNGTTVHAEPFFFEENGVTVAGGNGEGNAAAQLLYPRDVFVVANGDVYVADTENHRIQKWSPGATVGVTVAGGNGYGSAASQLASPTSVFVDAADNVYVGDDGNYRVQKWAPGATEGVTVAGGNGYGNAANQLSVGLSGLFVDAVGNVYVVDQYNYRIQKWAPGATEGVTVAGGNSCCGALNQIFPKDVWVAANGDLYIADSYDEDARVIKWTPGATQGSVVAGGNGQGSGLDQLDGPTSVQLDPDGNLLVSDGTLHRIVKWAPGASQGVVVAGGNGEGSAANQFQSSLGIFLDGQGDLYVTDQNNQRIQKFSSAAPSGIYSPTTCGTYTAIVTDTYGCVVMSNSSNVLQRFYADADMDGYGDPAVFQDACPTAPAGYVANDDDCNDTDDDINPSIFEICNNAIDENCDGTAVTLAAPIVTPASATSCLGQIVTLTADAPVQWFDAPTGGNQLGCGITLELAPNATQTVYAQANGFASSALGTVETGSALAIVDYGDYTYEQMGMAVTPDYVFVTGEDATARYDHNLENAVELPPLFGLFCDLACGKIYAFRNGDEFDNSNIDRIQEYDLIGQPVGGPVMLSEPITNLDGYANSVFNGQGFVLIYDPYLYDGVIYRINTVTGEVTVLKQNYYLDPAPAQGSPWSYYMAEFDGTAYSLVYRPQGVFNKTANKSLLTEGDPNTLVRMNLTTEAVSIVATFNDAGEDAFQWIFSPWDNRLFFSNEGNNQYTSDYAPFLFALDATNTGLICSGNEPRTPITVTVSSEPVSVTGISFANFGDCDDESTNCDEDDTFTSDVTVTYTQAAASGTLALSGTGIVGTPPSVDVSSIGATSHTFTGVKLLASGGEVTATFSAAPICDNTADYEAMAPCSGATPITNIQVSGYADNFCQYTGANGPFSPGGTYNGAPVWYGEFNGLTIRWNGTEWEIHIASLNLVLSTNNTGSITNLPCTGWTDVSCSGSLPTVTGGCGNFEEPPCEVTNITLGTPSDCDDPNFTVDPTDDVFTVDVTVTYAYAPSGGILTLKQGTSTLASTSIDLTCTTSYTFEDVQMAADGAAIVLTAELENCTFTSGNLGNAPTACSCTDPSRVTGISLDNVSDCNSVNTSCSTDDFFTADVTVTYTQAPASGMLSLSGAGIIGTHSVPVVGISATSHTFTGVNLRADGAHGEDLAAAFSDVVDCDFATQYDAVFPCSGFVPQIIQVSGFGSSCNYLNGTYEPNGQQNGAPKWTIQGSPGFSIYWSGSEWLLDGSILGNVAANSNGSLTNLPCTGWVSIGNGSFCGDPPSLSGGCGSLTGPPCAVSDIALGTPSACDDNETSAPSDDFFTADVTVTFAYAPSGGTLTLKRGSTVLATTTVDLTCTTTHTFEDVQMAADGASIVLTAEFDEDCTFTSASLGNALASCSCSPATFTACPTAQMVSTAVNATICTAVATYTATADGTPAPVLTYSFSGATTGTGSGTGSSSTFNLGITNVTVTATNACSTPTCQFTVTVADNTLPTATCQNITVNPDASGSVGITPAQVDNGSTDNCGTVNLVSVTPNSFTCSNLGANTVTLVVNDGNGNVAQCTTSVTVQDNTLPTAVCQNITVQLDANGSATITAAQIDNGSSDNCSVASLSLSKYTFTCADINGGGNLDPTPPTGNVTLTVSDQSNNQNTCQATVTVQDITPPSVTCQPHTVSLNASGMASVTTANVYASGSDNCGTVNQVNVSPNSFTCSNLGANTVTLTLNDGNGNTNTCTATVTVQDNTQPSVTCKPATVNLSSTGTGSITTADVFQSGSDNCGTVNQVSVTPNSFTCSNLGANTVTLLVSDPSNNTATCTSTVTVSDNIAPTATCLNITVNPDASGSVGITPAQVDNGSTDNCGTVNLVSVSPNSFTCSNLSPNTVTLTINDGNGNMNTCTATVTVQDNILPTAICQNISVQLDGNGMASITPAQVNNGSVDNCGTVNLVSVTPNSFDASNTGANTVTLTINDGHGNTNTCTAIITVGDNTPPNAICQNITVALDPASVNISPAQVNDGSNDNSGTVSLISVTPNSFTCSNLGANTVTLLVSDPSNNTATCTSTVTVSDNIAPMATCQNITVNPDASGSVGITPAQVDNGSTDNCGTVNLVSVTPNSFTCSSLGPNTVTLTINDGNGNMNTCTATVTVQDVIPPSVACQGQTLELTAGGTATITTTDVFQNGSDNCGTVNQVSVTPSNFNCGNLGANTVTLLVNDGHGNTNTCTATVTVQDNTPPTATCKPYTAMLVNSSVNIAPADVYLSGSDNCGTVNLTSVTPSMFGCANVGANTVTLLVNDGHGNTATCTATVTVVDNTPPVAACKNVTVQLDNAGQGTTTAQAVNNGSFDFCGIASLSLSPFSFSCANAGTNTVTLTVTDNNGNTSTCTATVTVEDNVAPVAICKNIAVNLDANGNGSTTAAALNNNSSDACGIASLSATPLIFTCADIGANTVTLAVEDNHGNTKTCTSTVTVKDVTPPTATCEGFTVDLNSGGTYALTPAMFFTGGTDGCGTVAPVSVSPTILSCNNIGQAMVTLSASDGNGNTGTCQALVTVNPFISVTSVTTTPETCGGGNGSITIVASSAAAQLAYSLNGGQSFYLSSTIPALTAGTYTLLIRAVGAAGCDMVYGTVTVGGAGLMTTWYKDIDNDGYSDGLTLESCNQPMGFKAPADLLALSGDCNDNNPDIHAGAQELCNGLDDDCNGLAESTGNTWTGLGDGTLWSDPANWSDGIVPLQCQDVTIPAGKVVIVPAGFHAVGKTLDVKLSADLTVELTGTMDIEN